MKKKLQKIILDSLLGKGVTHTNDGTPLQELDYWQLREIAVLSSIKEVDVEHSSNEWF